MKYADDLDVRISQIEERRRKIEREIKSLIVESNGLYNEQVLLTNEKYRNHISISENETSPDVLSQVVYDAEISGTAADRLIEWIHSFGKNFLPAWGNLNGEGTMPSAELGFEEDEEITSEIVSAVSRFSALVHGGTGYAVFPLREHSYHTTGNWHLIVSGENFGYGKVLDLKHFSQLSSLEMQESLEETLVYITQERWML